MYAYRIHFERIVLFDILSAIAANILSVAIICVRILAYICMLMLFAFKFEIQTSSEERQGLRLGTHTYYFA